MRKLKIPLLLTAALAGIWILATVVENIRGKAAWDAFRTEWEARGEVFDYRALVPEPIPSEKNFAHTPLLKPHNDYLAARDAGRRPEALRIVLAVNIEWDEDMLLDPWGNWESGHHLNLSVFQKSFREGTSWPHPEKAGKPAEDVLQALTVFDDEFAELSNAAIARPRCRFDRDYEKLLDVKAEPDGLTEMSFDHVRYLRRATECYTLRAVARLAAGDAEGAFADVKMGLFITDCFAAEPTMISQLVRMGGMLNGPLQVVWEGLAGAKWNDQQLASLEKRLGEINLLESYHWGMEDERNRGNYFIERLRNGAATDLDGNGIIDGKDVFWPWWYPSGWLYQNQLRLNQIHLNFSRRIVDLEAHLVKPGVAAEHKQYFEENKGDRYNLVANLTYIPINIANNFGRGQTCLDQARIACMLERYKIQKGKYPASLSELGAALPTDPFSGKAYLYSLDPETVPGKRYRLRGVGPDQKDDRKKPIPAEPDDLLWRYLPDPAIPDTSKPVEK